MYLVRQFTDIKRNSDAAVIMQLNFQDISLPRNIASEKLISLKAGSLYFI